MKYVYTLTALFALGLMIGQGFQMRDVVNSVDQLSTSLTQKIAVVSKATTKLTARVDGINEDVGALEAKATVAEEDDKAAKAAVAPSRVAKLQAPNAPEGRKEITSEMTMDEITEALKHNKAHDLTVAAHKRHMRAYRRCMSGTIKAIRKEISSRSGLGRWTIAPLVDNTDCNGLVLKPEVASDDQRIEMAQLVLPIEMKLSSRYVFSSPVDENNRIEEIVIARLTDDEYAEAKYNSRKSDMLDKLEAKRLKLKVALAKKLMKLEDTQEGLEESTFTEYQATKAKAKKLAKAKARARAQRRLKKVVRLQATKLRALEGKINAMEQAESVEEIDLDTE